MSLLRSFCFLLLIGIFATTIGCGKRNESDSQGPSSVQTAVELDGQGATFVEPIMKFWTEEYLTKTNEKVKINYQGNGSGQGVSSMTKKVVAFGCSDYPMNKKQLAEAQSTGGDVVHFPLVIGAVVPIYNLPEVKVSLKFTGKVLAEIFMGKITKWNDSKLGSLNPGVTLPDMLIQPVYRADSSGTSFIFSNYLSKIDSDFKRDVGASSNPKWPVKIGISMSKSEGVGGHIDRTPGSIGYIELTYALDKKAAFGSVQNSAGKDILANFASISAAADASLGVTQTEEPYSLHDLTYDLTNASGDNSYPISGISFGLIYKNLEGDKVSGDKGKALIAFLKWITSAEGQEMAKKRNYAPLPSSLQEKVHKKLSEITVN